MLSLRDVLLIHIWNVFYFHSFEQSNGIRYEQTGELRNPGSKTAFVAVKGSYAWTAPNGDAFIIDYIADENGFQPTIAQGVADSVSPKVVAHLLG